MFTSQKLKETNIAAYLIYMWQAEDIIRASGLDIDLIRTRFIEPSGAGEKERKELEEWYKNLIGMMREEQVIDRGHLQINKNVIINLTELHSKLLASAQFPFYSSAYYKALPYIVELRNKSGKKDIAELETCFEALYGTSLLRVQKKPVSKETATAVRTISTMLSLLADYYNKERNGELETHS